jgi:hypothetical protein
MPAPRLTLRPAAGLTGFAVVAPSGAVLAVVPRTEAHDALARLTRAVPPKAAVSLANVRRVPSNDNCNCERCVA